MLARSPRMRVPEETGNWAFCGVFEECEKQEVLLRGTVASTHTADLLSYFFNKLNSSCSGALVVMNGNDARGKHAQNLYAFAFSVTAWREI